MELTICRTYYEDGTNGRLYADGEFLGFTIELPWRDNAKMASCIPEGRYELAARYSEQFHDHLILKNVPNRSLILIHPANNAIKELRGCIAPVSVLTGPGVGLRSRLVFTTVIEKVYKALHKGEAVHINIKKNLENG